MKALVFLMLCIFTVHGLKSNVWLTTADQKILLRHEAEVDFVADSYLNNYVIDVDSTIKFQEMDGYGSALTDSSAWLITYKLNDGERENLLQSLFNASRGIGLNILRQPMGACDFSLKNYSYDDTCCDTRDFSINYDRQYIVPLLKHIKAINPDLLLIGTPWSPPGWMKTGGKMIGGRLKKTHYKELANYFVKYVQAYDNEGLPIYAVTVQNEANYEPESYPGMILTAEEETEFVRDHLGPEFRKKGIKTKILIWDHNWDKYEYPLKVLSDPVAKDYVAGTAFHCYAGYPSQQSIVHRAHPDKGVWQTECSDGEWVDGGRFETLFSGVVADQIVNGARNWGKSVVKWNLALDETNGPRNGGCPNCYGAVQIRNDGRVIRKPEYYSSGHASKFVRKGAKRVQSTSHGSVLESVAFQNPNGEIALVTVNSGPAWTSFKVRYGTESLLYSLESGSVATFTWPGTSDFRRLATGQIEAESYASIEGGGATDTCQDDSGCGSYVGYTHAGVYVVYKAIDFGTFSLDKVASRVATESKDSGGIALRLDNATGSTIASITIPSTGNWGNWVTKTANLLRNVSGVHDLYVVFGKSVNLNWFRFYQSAIQPNRKYRIISKLSGKDLYAKDGKTGTILRQWNYVFSDNHHFKFNRVAEGRYLEIEAVASGNVLEVYKGSLDNFAPVKLSAPNAAKTEQHWRVTESPEGDGHFEIINPKSGKAMDVKDRNLKNGASIQVFAPVRADGQFWYLVPA